MLRAKKKKKKKKSVCVWMCVCTSYVIWTAFTSPCMGRQVWQEADTVNIVEQQNI